MHEDALGELLARDAELLGDILRMAAKLPELEAVVAVRAEACPRLFDLVAGSSAESRHRPAFG
jgi:hypothetical protein